MSSTAHLSATDVEEIGRRLDAIRDDVAASLGADDAAYIRALVALQRKLAVGGRAALFAGLFPPAWLAGVSMLSLSKILENMEIGHNVLHGQWDWMNDPAIHSTTWDWDNTSPASEWKTTHNYRHHTFTNIIGKDPDVGYGVLRMAADQRWNPFYLVQPLVYLPVTLFFEYAIAIHDLEFDKARKGEKSWGEVARLARPALAKAAQQVAKDYVFFPLLAGPAAPAVLAGNVTANVARNIWSNVIIMCGHFPEGTETFTEDRLEHETRAEWYLRQMAGSANIEGGPLFHVMTGNLSHQIEHHLFPNLPSNHYAEIAEQVRELCAEYDLPYTTGPLRTQYASVVDRLFRFALPPGLIGEPERPSSARRVLSASVARVPGARAVGGLLGRAVSTVVPAPASRRPAPVAGVGADGRLVAPTPAAA